ncbi:cytochrome b [Wenxinia marina]|uniref:Cytochrome B561 n=1 Tax=Wenxinia marina DSM 24838 TaxID=1123501 RepID=A0A0D0QFD0_9RHOB|nr:cytochrome b/b6 domain-containing protein [Wenxinia marina]KIQ69683.1 Cytochrome B561 [Wenxinia marina DSM 24838]GGL60332.1 cytochrome b [Wenxinia marina]
MTVATYSRAQIALHWTVAILVVATWLLHDRMEEAFDARMDGDGVGALPLHAWLGLTVLALTLIRLALRLTRGVPPPPADDPPAMQAAANWTHRLIYLLLIAIPAGGAVAWFGQVEDAGDVHGTIANILMIIALGHALVALWHQYVKKDGLLRRMMRAG